MVTTDKLWVKGLVIGQVDYKESSKIIRIFTRELGIISLMARGVKRSNNKLKNLTSLYSFGKFELVKKGDFFYLEDGKLLDLNEGLRLDLKNIYSAQLCIELVERSLMEYQVNFDLFDLLIKTIKFLSLSKEKVRLMAMFVIKYVSMIGYRPELRSCVICGKSPTEKGFSIEHGGITCLDHQIMTDYINENEFRYLNFLMFARLDQVDDWEFEVDEKKIFRNLLAFVMNRAEVKKPNVLDAFFKFVLN